MNVSFENTKSILIVYHATSIIVYTEKETFRTQSENKSYEMVKYKKMLEIVNIVIGALSTSLNIMEYVDTRKDATTLDIILQVEENIAKMKYLLSYSYGYTTYRSIVSCIFHLYMSMMFLKFSKENIQLMSRCHQIL